MQQTVCQTCVGNSLRFFCDLVGDNVGGAQMGDLMLLQSSAWHLDRPASWMQGKMEVTPMTLWMQTGLALAGAVAGLILHLSWHPLRRCLSEAWDLLTSMRWLVVLSAGLMLLAEACGERWLRPLSGLDALLVWRDCVPGLLLESVMEYARMFHGLLPVWPGALLLPLALVLLSWRVIRFPYRYGPRRQQPVERWFLTGGMVVSWGWLIMEVVAFKRVMPEWLETLRVALRAVFGAVTMAFSQVLLIRMIIAWDQPEHPDDQKDLGLAVEHTFARWRGVVGLAVLDLLWLLLPGPVADGVSRWFLVEGMLLFLAVPVAVARDSGTLLTLGAVAMQMLGRALPALLGMLFTGTAVLLLARYASALLLGLAGEKSWPWLVFMPVHALALATVRNWVFLASVLTLLRHGLNPSFPKDQRLDVQ